MAGQITNTSPPSISDTNGSPTYWGHKLTTANGSWFSCGESITGYQYQWLRNGAAISGQTASDYYVESGNSDVGASLKSEVEACNAEGCSGFVQSSNAIVPTDRPPSAPSSLSPADGAVTGTTPRLSSVFSDPDLQTGYVSYSIYRYSDEVRVTYGSGPWVSSGSASAWTSSALGGGLYYWYAQAGDYSGTAGPVAGPIFLDVPPPTPTLGSPGNSASLATATPVLSAGASDSEPISYEFQVATDSAFSNLVADGWVETTTTWTVPPGSLQDGAAYYWRVRAADGYGGVSGWSGARSLSIRLPKLGVRGDWPMWSHGPLAVNEANGNLVLTAPGPSYPTPSGSMGASLSYNAQSTTNNGLGTGWALNVGDQGSSPPTKLIDHKACASPCTQFDAVERFSADGSSDYYTHVGSSNTYLSSAGDDSHLTKNSDNSWTLVDPDGAIYTFNPDASDGTATLKSAEWVEASPGKGALTYTFSTVDPTKIKTISDDAGRTLSFGWADVSDTGTCSGAILCVTGPDNVTWKYVGDGSGGTSGRLVKVNDGTRDLLQVGYGSNGLLDSFKDANDLDPGHASPNYDSAGAHSLTVSYDASTPARVSSVSDGPVTNQSPATSTWSFSYHPGAIRPPTPPHASHYGYLVRNDAPLAYYPLDEPSGTAAVEASGNGSNGTYSGSYTLGQNGALAGNGSGTAVNFTGGTAAGSVSSLNLAPGAYNTVELWVKWDGTGVVMPFGFESYDLIFDGGYFGFNTGCGDVYGVSAPSANAWHYVVAEFYNGTPASGAKLWIDGVQQSLSQITGTACSSTVSSSFAISGWPDGGGYRMGGSVDEVAIYGYPLSRAQIAAHFTEAKHNREADGYTTLTPPNQQTQSCPSRCVTTYYDNLGHPIETVDTLGRTTESYYNAKSELLWSEDADGNPTDNLYGGPDGKPLGDAAVPDALLQTVGPDPDGSGPLARPVTTNRYDEIGSGTGQARGPSLNGLQASYFDNQNLAGRAQATENDANVDFSWPQGPPALAGQNLQNGFSVHWRGDLLITSPGSYTFSTPSSTGTRLTIDGTEAIDNWTSSAPTSQPITLSAGLHALVLDYFSNTASGAVHLHWACSACSPAISDQAIPTTSLVPGWLNQTSTLSPAGRLSFAHYANPASGQPDYSMAQAESSVGLFPSVSAKGGQGGAAAGSCAHGAGGSGGSASTGSSVSVSYSGGNGGSGYVYCQNGAVNGGAGGSSAGTGANGNSGQDGCFYTCTANGGTAPSGGGEGGNSYWSATGPVGDPGSAPGGAGGAEGATQCCVNYGAGSGADGEAVITPDSGPAVTYNTAGTYSYTVPSDVTSLTVQLWGAGGGGGRGYTNGGYYDGNYGEAGGGGGGGGAYVKTTAIQVGSGETLSVNVGAGGAAGAHGGCGYVGGCPGGPYGPASAGSAGGDSSVQESAPPTGNPPLITSYSYDADGRITQQVMPKGNAGRTIDPQGNLEASPDTTYATTYTYYGPTDTAAPPSQPDCSGSTVNQGQQLETATTHGDHTTTYVYDAAGNTLAKTNGAGSTCSQYNAESRLTSTEAPGDSQPTSYTYDPDGTQLTATDSGAAYLGEFGHTANSSGSTTKTVTLTGAPGAGNAVFLRVANANYTPGASAVTDSEGNTWVRVKQGTTGVANSLYATLQNVAPLKSGDLITVTFSGTVFAFAAVADAFSGVTSLTPDQTATASDSTGSTARNSGTTTTTTQDSELQIAVWGVNAADTAFTPTTGATAFHTPYLTSGAASAEGEYKFVNATGTYNLNATGGISAKYNGFIVTLPATAGGTVTTHYDEQNRLVHEIDANGAEATFSYDSDGNELSRTAAKGSLAGNPNYTTNYSYNAADQLTGETDPASNSYSFYYDDRGNLRGTQYPNGTFNWVDTNSDGWTSDQYNRHGTITATTITPPSDSSPLADYTYTYNQDGQRLSENRTAGSSNQTTSYSYDNLGRLNQVTLPSGTCRDYSYDLDSNRSQIQESPSGCNGTFSTAASYTYDPTNNNTPGVDQLTKITAGSNTTSYAYTSDGQTSSQGTTTYTWDGWGRLSTTTVGGNTLTYTYDPTGSLKTRSSSSPSSTLNYLLGDLFETDGSGAITTSYTDGPTGDLASYNGAPTSSSTVIYLYYDAHGNLAAEANTSGTQTGNYTYDPFGGPNDSVSTNTTTHRFVGRWDKQYDTTSGLILMGARPYDPTTGRFLSVDPIPGGSLNDYDYAGQDPINNYDLSGTAFVMDAAEGGDICCETIGNSSADGIAAGGAALAVGSVAESGAGHKTRRKDPVHHIVARRAWRAAPARAILARVHIGINDPRNLIQLSYDFHKGMHTTDYYEAVNRVLERAYSNGGGGVGAAAARVTVALAGIRKMLGGS